METRLHGAPDVRERGPRGQRLKLLFLGKKGLTLTGLKQRPQKWPLRGWKKKGGRLDRARKRLCCGKRGSQKKKGRGDKRRERIMSAG